MHSRARSPCVLMCHCACHALRLKCFPSRAGSCPCLTRVRTVYSVGTSLFLFLCCGILTWVQSPFGAPRRKRRTCPDRVPDTALAGAGRVIRQSTSTARWTGDLTYPAGPASQSSDNAERLESQTSSRTSDRPVLFVSGMADALEKVKHSSAEMDGHPSRAKKSTLE